MAGDLMVCAVEGGGWILGGGCVVKETESIEMRGEGETGWSGIKRLCEGRFSCSHFYF